MNTYTLRGATGNDYDFLYRLYCATMQEHVARIWGWDAEDQRARFQRTFAPQGQQIIVVDGEDVGVLRVEQRNEALFLANLQILPSYQGQGIGTAVITDILATARQRRVPVHLQVLKGNPARQLYDRLGFVVTGQTDTHELMSTAPTTHGITVSQTSNHERVRFSKQ